MSAASSLLSEDHFLCSICLDVFTDPVGTSCGHNFCKTCITKHWDLTVSCECPVCKKVFNTRPELQVNTFISEMVAHFKQSAQQRASSSKQQAAEPGEVPCDVCTGTKLKALKSCLVCLTSYCETHLEPHLTASSLKRHQLMEPVENLEGRMCAQHDKLLELFCRADQTCVCMLCTILDHKTHEVVPLKEECEGKKVELVKIEAELQQMIQERRLKIQETEHSVEVSRANSVREMAGINRAFTKMKDDIDRNEAKFTGIMKEEQRKMEKQAEGYINELKQEVSALEKRSAEMKQLSQSEDHLHLLQNFQSLNAAPPTKDWKKVGVCPPSYESIMDAAVEELLKMLEIEMKKLLPKLKEVKKFAVDVTFDPDTATKNLILSDDGKQVHYSDEKRNLPENPKRFSDSPCISPETIDFTPIAPGPCIIPETIDFTPRAPGPCIIPETIDITPRVTGPRIIPETIDITPRVTGPRIIPETIDITPIVTGPGIIPETIDITPRVTGPFVSPEPTDFTPIPRSKPSIRQNRQMLGALPQGSAKIRRKRN